MTKRIDELAKRLDNLKVSGTPGAKGADGKDGRDGTNHVHTLNIYIKQNGKVVHELKGVKLEKDTINVEIPIEKFVKK